MLGDSIAAALPGFRAQAESLMTDTTLVERVTGEATDPATGVVTPTWEAVYTGRCKLATYQPYEQTPEVGSSSPTLQRYSLHLPVTAGPFEIGDVATVGGRQFRIAGLHSKTWQTAKRFLIDEIVTSDGGA